MKKNLNTYFESCFDSDIVVKINDIRNISTVQQWQGKLLFYVPYIFMCFYFHLHRNLSKYKLPNIKKDPHVLCLNRLILWKRRFQC